MPSQLNIEIRISQKPGFSVIAFEGELDETVLEMTRTKIDPILNDAAIKAVVFDLTNLKFINSKGIGYLVAVHSHLAKAQKKLILAAANENVMDVMSLVGLTTIIPYFPAVEQAVA
jgi:stage II sporulation protein AA (anti-sigma F factor antagonist)